MKVLACVPLSRGRTFRTVYRTLPDIPDTDRTWFSDMIGHTIGHQSDIDRTLIGQYRTQIGRLFIYHNYRKAMSDDSVDGSIDSYGPVVVAGDLGAAQGRGSDRLGPYETAFSASITHFTVPHDMTDTLTYLSIYNELLTGCANSAPTVRQQCANTTSGHCWHSVPTPLAGWVLAHSVAPSAPTPRQR